MNKTPTTLIIMDGFGLSDEVKGNAVRGANTPVLDHLNSEYAHTQLSASGLDVGLPAGQMGNSEVGHTNIGGGRVVFQDLPRISRAIEDGTFFENPAYNAAMDACLEKGTALHLYGLLSNGGVHSTVEHVWALLKMAGIKGLKRVYLHCFLDGRDVSPTSGADFVAEAQKKCAELGVGKIATVMGRYYAMDRDKRWERIEEAWQQLVNGKGTHSRDLAESVRASYAAGVTDEFIKPVVKTDEVDRPVGTLQADDAVLFINFRNDRARELTSVLTQAPQGSMHPLPLWFATMTPYDAAFKGLHVLFAKENVVNPIGEYVSSLGLKQLRIAETEKYAHVTFFLNGGREEPFANEDRILVPSPKVATYDLQPEMSAPEVAQKLSAALLSGQYDFICLNFANGDMVGHTGVWSAIEKAVRTVDDCVKQVIEAAQASGTDVVIIADHGNADHARNADGSPNTAHSLNPVPIIVVSPRAKAVHNGVLADVAPTVLTLMGVPVPPEMTGKSLVELKA